MGSEMTSVALQDAQQAIVDVMPSLRKFARSLTGSADAADELVQAAYERALRSPETLTTVEQPIGWMFRIIRNIWIDETRCARNRLSAPLEEGEHIATDDTERTLTARSTLARVRAVVADMPEEQSAAIMLVCVDGLTYQEAATVLRIPVGTLMSRLCRGRLELARRFKDTGTKC
jgi:RNA polymerase sigma-70 factor, ECF subfamily